MSVGRLAFRFDARHAQLRVQYNDPADVLGHCRFCGFWITYTDDKELQILMSIKKFNRVETTRNHKSVLIYSKERKHTKLSLTRGNGSRPRTQS